MASSLPIEKLKGRENYNTWKFAMQALLEHEDLWEVIINDDEKADGKKVAKARAKIILAVDPINYSHIQDTITAKETWEKLKTVFEDSGLTRKVGLLRQLVTTQLNSCNSTEEFVNTITITAHKLNNLGFKVNDEWIGALLLAGLSDEYKPMIMGLESSGIPITGDAIKTKLLQDVKIQKSNESALYSKNKKNFHKKPVRCYSCNKLGHISANCKVKSKKDMKNRNDIEPGNYKQRAFFALYTSNIDSDKNQWYLDSCASSHMTPNADLLYDINPCTNTEIIAADNTKLSAKIQGTVKLNIKNNNCNEVIEAKDVLHVPNLAVNLLSVSRIVKKDFSVIFDKNGCRIIANSGEIFATGSLHNGVYKLNTEKSETCLFTNNSVTSEIWHRRLGHINSADLIKMKNGAVEGLMFKDRVNISKDNCIVCCEGKQSRLPFPKGNRVKNPLEVIHADVCGPMETKSIGGSRYFLTFQDDFTRMTFIYFLKSKDETFNCFQNFQSLVENQQESEIKVLRTDNGGEFCSYEFENYLKKNGIIHQKTNPYTPEQNGMAERLNRSIVEKAKCLLFDADLEKELWAEAVNTAVYLKNRSISAGLSNKTPLEMWTGAKPNLSHLKIFGSTVMMHVPKEKRQKWDKKAKKCILVGYSENTKGFRIYNPMDRSVTTSRDVIIMENIKNAVSVEISKKLDSVGEELEQDQEDLIISENDKTEEDTPDQKNDVNDENGENVYQNNEEINIDQNNEEIINVEHNFEEINLNDFQENNLLKEDAVTDNVRRSKRTPKPKKFDEYHTYIAAENSWEPKTFEEALASCNKELWKKAMDEEINSLMENQTWEEVNPPEDRTFLKTKWVYKIKRKT